MAGEEGEMLRALGAPDVDALFADIPAKVRVKGVPLPPGLSEAEVAAKVAGILRANRVGEDLPTFLGAGLYDHYVPAAVRAVVARSEFYTACTPAPAALSPGILQA